MSPSTNTLVLTSPKQGAVYHVGNEVLIKATLSPSSELYKKNPKVTFFLRKNLSHPIAGFNVGSANVRDLVHTGIRFKVLSKYLDVSSKTLDYVAATFEDQGTLQNVPSGVFQLEK